MFVPVQDMKAYEGVEVWLHPFSTSTLYVGEWSPLHLVCFATGTHWKGGRVGLKPVLETVE